MATEFLQCVRCSHIGHFDRLHNDDAACNNCGEISKHHTSPPPKNITEARNGYTTRPK